MNRVASGFPGAPPGTGATPTGLPEREAAALGQVRALLCRLVEAGVERASRGSIDEIDEAARTAHQGRLASIERDLTALSTRVARWLERDPQFRIGAWTDAVSRLWWRTVAAGRVLADPEAGDERRAEVLGVQRRTYTPVDGTRTVAALGASGWVSDTGFAGITVHLWEPASGRTFTATQARPVGLVDGDPRRLLFTPVSQVSLLTVFELSHGAWELDDVRLSPDGRLSLHAGLVAVPRPPLGAAAYEAHAVPGAAALIDRLAEEELDPAGGGGAVHAFVEVAAIRDVVVDETAALAGAELVDRAGTRLRVVIPVRPERDLLVDNLARLAAGAGPPLVGVFGRATLGTAGVRFEPYTVVFDQPVRLALRRRGEVQEVHLGLEPLPGEGEARRGRLPADPAGDGPAARAIAATRRAIQPLFASGLGWPGPDVAEGLRSSAERWGEVGAEEVAARLAGLAGGVDALRRGERGDLPATHEALQWVAAWVRLARAGVAADEARERLRGPQEPTPDPVVRGEDFGVVPLGAERDGHRLTVYALDARDGGPVTLHDELPGLDDDVFGRPWPSRLFQQDLRLDALLRHRVELRGHPVQRVRGTRVVRPAFRAAPTLGAPLGPSPVPKTPDPVPGPVFRTDATAERGPDGWVLRVGARGQPVAVDDPLLQLDLEKRAAVDALSFELLGRLQRERVVVLQVDGRFPTLDPRATRWAPGLLEARAAGDPVAEAWLAAARGGPLPELPGPDAIGETVRGLDPAEVAPFLARRVAALREALGQGAVLPPAADLIRLGRAVAGEGTPPILALPVPRPRLWLAAASALSAWIRGVAGADGVDALALVAGGGFLDLLEG